MRSAHRPIRPAEICSALLAALDASEGRSRRRKRDQTPDRIGLGVKRALLESAVREDPEPAVFERWLLERCLKDPEDAGEGAVRAMAQDVLLEWRLAQQHAPFRHWLARGAPSDDAQRGPGGAPEPAASPAHAPGPRRARGSVARTQR